MARRPTPAVRRLGRLPFPAILAASAACDPYERFGKGDDSLGPVDPLTFPAANLGLRGDRKRAGLGTFTEVRAFVESMQVGYFAYPLPALPPGADARRVLDDDKPYPAVPTPRAYVFDAREGRPFPDRHDCAPPVGYTHDPRRDEVRADEQGNVFSALPQATYSTDRAATTTYVPVVAEVPVSSAG
jgi:hypothetical protein